ncbi:hypothetical protein C3L50_05915 [Flavobacterium alvei]|uniref:Secretion protein n=1 Tax=Flavobacterium alvei TaxID=2080416 RepID=A0A2S5ACQ3_9FLAO|nr:hypothetical protein [Flavobacterium alvei]POY40182.1 hypothetical protein C3L50_05915 [Flavobacterium alvei]HQK40954.1 hypothetical protein [Flavobacterium alvei]
MKNLFKFSLVLGVALLTMNVHASDIDFSLGVKKEEGRIITIVLNDAKKMDLSIYDVKNRLIHSENVASQKVINRTYDLKDLPEGTYYLEAESELKISRYKISVVGSTAVLSETAISDIYKPVFIEKDGLLTVSFINSQKSSATIKIYDHEDNEVYDSGLLKDQKISKSFDLSNIKSDGYTFVINYDDKSFIKSFDNK